jgi:hypothetical protein
MDIEHSPKGTKIKFVAKNPISYGVNQDNAKHLIIGNVYTVSKTEMHSYHTKVFLDEVPNIPFNSVWFDEVN